MLSCFKIKNFRSILDLKVDLSYGEGKAPNNYREWTVFPFLETPNKKKFVPCLSLYGANASGKTNVIKALLTFRQIVRKGIENCFFPNKLNPKYDYSGFDIEFFVGRDNFKYGIEYNAVTIHKEYLIKNGIELYYIDKTGKNNLSKIATEDYTEQKLNNIISVECSNFISEDKLVQTLPFLNKICSAYKGLNRDLNKAYDFICKSLVITLTNDLPYRMLLNKLAATDTNRTTEQNIQEAFNKLATMMKKFDIDIQRMSFNREIFHLPETKTINIKGASSVVQNHKENTVEVDYIKSYHKDINGAEVQFNFSNDESNGTNVLLPVLGCVLLALQNGSVLIIDELDRALHPMLVAQIVQMFKDKQYNQTNAQLIFTSHATDILTPDTFRVSEVAIINKTLEAGTTLKRISDYEKVRNITDYRRLYWNGGFGGIPFAYI